MDRPSVSEAWSWRRGPSGPARRAQSGKEQTSGETTANLPAEPLIDCGAQMAADQAVVTSFDENYLMPGLVAAVSAARNTPDDVRVAILGVGLSSEAKRLIKQTISAERLELIEADEFAKGMQQWGRISSAAWGRIGIGSLLPASIRRVHLSRCRHVDPSEPPTVAGPGPGGPNTCRLHRAANAHPPGEAPVGIICAP